MHELEGLRKLNSSGAVHAKLFKAPGSTLLPFWMPLLMKSTLEGNEAGQLLWIQQECEAAMGGLGTLRLCYFSGACWNPPEPFKPTHFLTLSFPVLSQAVLRSTFICQESSQVSITVFL